MVFTFTGLGKTQISKMPYRDSSHHENGIHMSFKSLNLVQPNEHKEDFYVRKPNDKVFLFQVKNIEYVYVGEKVFSFEMNEKKVDCF